MKIQAREERKILIIFLSFADELRAKESGAIRFLRWYAARERERV
jgi:hypothetical protein